MPKDKACRCLSDRDANYLRNPGEYNYSLRVIEGTFTQCGRGAVQTNLTRVQGTAAGHKARGQLDRAAGSPAVESIHETT